MNKPRNDDERMLSEDRIEWPPMTTKDKLEIAAVAALAALFFFGFWSLVP